MYETRQETEFTKSYFKSTNLSSTIPQQEKKTKKIYLKGQYG